MGEKEEMNWEEFIEKFEVCSQKPEYIKLQNLTEIAKMNMKVLLAVSADEKVKAHSFKQFARNICGVEKHYRVFFELGEKIM